MAYQTMVIAAVSWLQPPNLHLIPSHTCLARVRLPWLSCIYNICANIDDYIQLREEKMRGRPFLPFFPSPFSSFFSFLPPFSPLSGRSKSLPPHDLKASQGNSPSKLNLAGTTSQPIGDSPLRRNNKTATRRECTISMSANKKFPE